MSWLYEDMKSRQAFTPRPPHPQTGSNRKHRVTFKRCFPWIPYTSSSLGEEMWPFYRLFINDVINSWGLLEPHPTHWRHHVIFHKHGCGRIYWTQPHSVNAYEFFILQLGCKIFQEACKGMVGARKMPQSHIHKPPEERNKGSIKYIQSCGEIRSFCCVWWRKGEMAGKRKDQPTLSVSIIWEIVGFHFHRKVKTTWLTSQRVKPVLKGCDCGKMFPLFPSNAPSQHTNTFTSQHTNTFTS